MTREEAIQIIKSECYVFNPFNFDCPRMINTALDMAIEALEQEYSRSAEITQYRHDCEKLMEENERLKKTLEQQPCEDCISRQAAIDAFERFIHQLGIEDEPYNYGEIALSAKNVPPVTPQQNTGHWITLKDEYGDIHEAVCSCCDKNGNHKWAYCPNCGAKMESEVKNDNNKV